MGALHLSPLQKVLGFVNGLRRDANEIWRSVPLRNTAYVCYHLMMGRTRDNSYILLAHHSSHESGGALYARRRVVARALWRGFVARLRQSRILPVLVASIGEAIQNQEFFQVLESKVPKELGAQAGPASSFPFRQSPLWVSEKLRFEVLNLKSRYS